MKPNQLITNKNYKYLYLAGITSEFGSYLLDTALMLWLFSITEHEKIYLGLSRAIFILFLTLGSILGGAAGDRLNKKTLLIICESIRIPVVLLMILYPTVLILLLGNGIIAFFTGVFNPARQALVNELVGAEHINTANSIFATTLAFLHFVCPVVAALLFTRYQSLSEIGAFDIATFLLGIFFLLKIELKIGEMGESEGQSYFQMIKSGLSYAKKRNDLTWLYLNTVFQGLAIGILIPLLLPFTIEHLKLSESHYGYLIGAFGLGGILGGILSNSLNKVLKTTHLILLCFLLEPVIMLIWLNIIQFWLSMAAILTWGICVFIRIPSQMNFISHSVPKGYLSRVFALLEMSFIVPNIMGGLVVALAGSQLNTYDFLEITAILYCASLIVRIPIPGCKTFLKTAKKS